MKQTLEEFIEAYKRQAGPICTDLWDEIDTVYVARLYHPPKEDDDDRDS